MLRRSLGHAPALTFVLCCCLHAAHLFGFFAGELRRPPVRPGVGCRAAASELRATSLDLERLGRLLRLSPLPAPPLFAAVSAQLPCRLRGTLIDQNGAWSMALLEDEGGRVRTVMQGDQVFDWEVGALERGRAWLVRAGERRALEMGAPVAAAPVRSPAAPAVALGSSLRQEGPGEYSLSRRELDAALAEPEALWRGGRVVPAFEGGRLVGFRLFALSPGGLFARLGAQNGDLLRRVNGVDLAQPDALARLMVDLRDLRRVEVEGTRAGAPFRLRYRVE